jgi:small nuclear ribonucleoprotein (snRNP)-like protein
METELDKYISRILRVVTKDGRAFFGVLVCANKDKDLILQDTTERRTDLRRFVGMVVIRGVLIESISLLNQ